MKPDVFFFSLIETRSPMKFLLKLLLFACLGLNAVLVQAKLPEPPQIAAKAYLLMDVTADQILASRDIDTPVEPASLTKIMTAYVVFDALRNKTIHLEQSLPVSEKAWKMPGSRMFIEPSMQVPVEDLIKGMIVQSGNDASVALAEGVAGSTEAFVQLMNQQAKQMDLKKTHFENVEGLTVDGHSTTARDLATMATRLMQDFPDDFHYYSIKKYRYPGTPESNDTNRNTLLFRDPTVDGLKTGYTEAAGYNMVATAKRDFPNLEGRRLLSIVLGTESESARANESQKLLNWGFTAFEDVELFAADAVVASPRIWKGDHKELSLGSQEPVIVAVPSGEAEKITTEVLRPEPLLAPIEAGQVVATLKVLSGDDILREVPLIALEEVRQAGLFGRLWDSMRLWFGG